MEPISSPLGRMIIDICRAHAAAVSKRWEQMTIEERREAMRQEAELLKRIGGKDGNAIS